MTNEKKPTKKQQVALEKKQAVEESRLCALDFPESPIITPTEPSQKDIDGGMKLGSIDKDETLPDPDKATTTIPVSMTPFIGTKRVNAASMNLGEYNKLRGWELPVDEDEATEGMLVEYLDGGAPCHPSFNGYISWSPQDVFDGAYKASGNFTFGDALLAMQAGCRVARAGWNGKGMFVIYQGETELGTSRVQPFAIMKCADDTMIPWLCSQADMFATDWAIV